MSKRKLTDSTRSVRRLLNEQTQKCFDQRASSRQGYLTFWTYFQGPTTALLDLAELCWQRRNRENTKINTTSKKHTYPTSDSHAVNNDRELIDRFRNLKALYDLKSNLHTGHSAYWAVQAWLLTPLTFAPHRLSPLADFTSGAYFLYNGRR